VGDDRRRHERGDAGGGGQAGARPRRPTLSAATAAPRLGITIPFAGRALFEQAALLEHVEHLGYTDVFTQETEGHDAFTPLGYAAALTSRVRLGSAIGSVFTRGPALLAMQAAALAEAAPGRFVLGLGTSSRTMVEGWNGLPFARPLARARETLGVLRRLLAGERVDFAGETVTVRGFRLERAPASVPPILLAALGPRMLELAAREADGVILSLVGPDDVSRVRAALAAAVPAAVAREVVMRIGVIVDEDAEVARAHCRRLLAAYLSVDRYAALHRRLGRGALLEPVWRAWQAGDRRAAVAAVPDALVDALFVHGDVAACRRGLARFRAAGVSTPVVALMRWRGALEDVLADLAHPD
jgi:probable F420-dependent oxidoreductase